MIDRKDPLPVTRQWALPDLPRSTFYHVPNPVSEEELELMALIDRCHLKHLFYGSRSVFDWLEGQGYRVNRRKAQRLMRTMDLVAQYPKRNISLPNPARRVYPYLPRNLLIDHPNQVWATDIIFTPMTRGFVYLVAVLDWYSHKVLSWRISNTLDASFCVEAVEETIESHGTSEIFNTNQCSQLTSEDFIRLLKQHDIRIRIYGKGGCVDNVFLECPWHGVKFEGVYLKAYYSIGDARASLGQYITCYNNERRH